VGVAMAENEVESFCYRKEKKRIKVSGAKAALRFKNRENAKRGVSFGGGELWNGESFGEEGGKEGGSDMSVFRRGASGERERGDIHFAEGGAGGGGYWFHLRGVQSPSNWRTERGQDTIG